MREHLNKLVSKQESKVLSVVCEYENCDVYNKWFVYSTKQG